MKVLLSVLLLLSGVAQAQCIPPNNKFVGLNEVTASKIGYTSFKDAIAKVQKAYAGEVAARGAVLQINDMWTDGTVNAQAYQEMKDGKLMYYVDAFGGLARYPGMTKNAFIAVLCHEVGHHLGGAPRYDRNTDWGSVEGQADYFATLNCMKKLGLPSMNGSLALAKVLADLGEEKADYEAWCRRNQWTIRFPTWEFNGDLDKPTFSPSIHVDQHVPVRTCHSYIRNGMIEFLMDSWHNLRGQRVELPDCDS